MEEYDRAFEFRWVSVRVANACVCVCALAIRKKEDRCNGLFSSFAAGVEEGLSQKSRILLSSLAKMGTAVCTTDDNAHAKKPFYL